MIAGASPERERAGVSPVLLRAQAPAAASTDGFHDSHFHLTNYVQQGIEASAFLNIMGTRVGRSTLFGIPLQQQWSHANSGDFAPTYYLQSDAPLYYYSFTDAYIASVFLKLPQQARARFDPMITGFNPADMYAVDHIKRVLATFPGVFTGIGEFSIHKEFVSAKIAGETASLTNPALDRILEFAGESGLVVLQRGRDRGVGHRREAVDATRAGPTRESGSLQCARKLVTRPRLEQLLASGQ